LSDADVDQLRDLIVRCGATAEVESMITARGEQAIAALDAVGLDATGRDALVALARVATQRTD
jgi:geranylgeranyl diphosphate synthase type I